ncbi:nucleoside-binding protein [Selenomonas ruminantium]|uniref:Nucleoside-binding protein n=1 Tax=Selenomonas ruminantium TaxID=971 RepID=A0A1M6R1Z5_SELRU|nr:BMP family ABC transporter substrate-binding protein [Selenomonas ruminantium]SHK26509.1 nucleoside-binding protein [Selenomonas ruminantium]
MRKILILVGLVFAAAITGIFLSKDSWTETDVTAKTTKVGLLLSGNHDDRSYCQSHYEAIKSLQDDLNLNIICRENVPNACYATIVELVQREGCEIIVGASFDYGSDMKKAANAFQNVYFLHAGGLDRKGNLSTYFGRMYQARYLSGIVAGMESKTGRIGYVAAFPIVQVIRGINAFTLGARSVRPDAQVYVRYCGSWTEDLPAERESQALLDNHPIDVLAMHTNSLAPNWVAERRGIYSIGYNWDNRDMFSDKYLTASAWDWSGYYRQQILACLTGKFYGSNQWIAMEDGVIKLADYSPQVSEQTKEVVRAAQERLRSREFDVFYGPIRDNQGRLRVEAGEAMSDGAMLNALDWYVEGVSVEQ